ncbi:uncharacterized protein EMH_0035740 [Eimeria mitis]|uniref:Uncharacterized protein n=1 Tax=Eimeria mitis TaxID=44415 RepID=U6JV13_9EIME|nr:uncharacterized protein EMH_0035740 [Eimeria mitis]CDJ27882.1 hypothetical protein EMH_0035740 [Eimeria mitis]
MGILRRIAGDLPAQTSGPPVVAGEGTDPAPENTDNSDIVVKAGGASLFERGRGKRPLVTKAVIAAFAVIVLWGARYIMSGRLISDLKTSKLGLEDVSQQPVENVSQQSLDDVSQPSPDDASEQPIDDVSMQKYIKDFNEAAKEMERAFPSESSVRQAFQLHFTPSLEDGQNLPGDPLAVIKDHVAKMEKIIVTVMLL